METVQKKQKVLHQHFFANLFDWNVTWSQEEIKKNKKIRALTMEKLTEFIFPISEQWDYDS